MLPLFEMMLRAQNGTAMEAVARQFNLAQEQAAQAVAALMPAFSSGFKRNTANPYDMTALLGAMASGNYAKYFEDMTAAFTPQGVADGNTVLEQLFGSKEVSRAIAAQAAQFTGISQDIFKKMMPAMADTIMGGLSKQTTGQFDASAFANSPMGAMTQQWLEGMGFAPKAKPKEPNLFDNPFTQAMQTMFGVKPNQPQPAPAAGNPFFDNPFAKAFQEMMASYTGTAPAPKSEAAKPAGKPADQAAEASEQFTTMVNTMFDSGLEVQKSYQKSMEQIFESYLGKAGEAPDEKPAPQGDAPPNGKA
ncbi:DUF937 domain-containing protein [Ciceribacter thiooxidans]|uniref:DUF937 domain-containing protein n=1 Tax=Ciceribacter thiooxidans TaxID=1969821 RepID=A0ABV7HY30_9HYPH|nr:DUF937 domain-containing protein [Ciceribacter thiooxidans]